MTVNGCDFDTIGEFVELTKEGKDMEWEVVKLMQMPKDPLYVLGLSSVASTECSDTAHLQPTTSMFMNRHITRVRNAIVMRIAHEVRARALSLCGQLFSRVWYSPLLSFAMQSNFKDRQIRAEEEGYVIEDREMPEVLIRHGSLHCVLRTLPSDGLNVFFCVCSCVAHHQLAIDKMRSLDSLRGFLELQRNVNEVQVGHALSTFVFYLSTTNENGFVSSVLLVLIQCFSCVCCVQSTFENAPIMCAITR